MRSTLKRIIPRPARDFLREQLKNGDALLAKLSSSYQVRRKYRLENEFWTGRLRALLEWHQGIRKDWAGIPGPTPQQKVSKTDDPALNAVLTLHRIYTDYLKRLMLEPNHFVGKKVLDVGCGPLAPSQQFVGAEHHLADPLLETYIASGWPMKKYGMTLTPCFAESIPYPDGFFDAVMSVNALDHVDDFGKAAAELQRLIKPGGGIYLEVEYHEPRDCEPQKLTDDVVRQSFFNCDLKKIADRDKKEVFRVLGRTDKIVDNDRLVIWHGVKKG